MLGRMSSPSVGAKLFNTIVVIGMSLSQTMCSDDGKTSQPVENGPLADASTHDSGQSADDSASSVPDAGKPSNDAFAGWFCCG